MPRASHAKSFRGSGGSPEPEAGRLSHHLHVVTGGPGAGKTSLVAALAVQGCAVVPEAGRAIIREELAAGGRALPWADRARFARRMLARDLRAQARLRRAAGPVFFDRGMPDAIGYLRLCGLPVPSAAWRIAARRRYATRVFFAPWWPGIYAPEAERRQDAAEAEATGAAMQRVYAELGYELVALPFASVAERVRFVLARLG